MGSQRACMRVNHYCKNRMDYRFKTNLAGNTPAFMCAVLNSERAALCLEGRGNKSKSSLRRDSPSVVWVASDARLKCCKVQREQSFVSRGVYLEGRENVTATSTFNHKNHKRRKGFSRLSCQQIRHLTPERAETSDASCSHSIQVRFKYSKRFH